MSKLRSQTHPTSELRTKYSSLYGQKGTSPDVYLEGRAYVIGEIIVHSLSLDENIPLWSSTERGCNGTTETLCRSRRLKHSVVRKSFPERMGSTVSGPSEKLSSPRR